MRQARKWQDALQNLSPAPEVTPDRPHAEYRLLNSSEARVSSRAFVVFTPFWNGVIADAKINPD
jgi:hypothetical protein